MNHQARLTIHQLPISLRLHLPLQLPSVLPQLFFLTLLCLFFCSGKIQAQPASLQGDILHIPVVVVENQFYSARLTIVSGTEPVEIVLSQATEVFSANLRDSSYFGNEVLSIPAIDIDGHSFWADFRRISSDRFRLIASGNNNSSRGSDMKTHTAWQRMPGEATDISIGADGSVWAIGTDERNGGYGIYHWNGDSWDRQSGGAVRIAVDPNGNPWIVNSEQDIYRWVNDQWEKLPGDATDIGIGADGSVWVTGYDEESLDFKLYRWNGDKDWDRISGRGISIAVDDSGNPWITNSEGKIYQRVGEDWQRLAGGGRDIGIGPGASVWIIGEKEVEGGFSIYQLNGEEWQRVEGSGTRIAVDNHGLPWVVNADGDIYRSR